MQTYHLTKIKLINYLPLITSVWVIFNKDNEYFRSMHACFPWSYGRSFWIIWTRNLLLPIIIVTYLCLMKCAFVFQKQVTRTSKWYPCVCSLCTFRICKGRNEFLNWQCGFVCPFVFWIWFQKSVANDIIIDDRQVYVISVDRPVSVISVDHPVSVISVYRPVSVISVDRLVSVIDND